MVFILYNPNMVLSMEQEYTSSSKGKSFSQTWVGGQLLTPFRYIIILLGFFGLFMFWMDTRPLPDRIETKFSMTLPDSARDFGWYDYSWSGYVTLAKFTVDIEDLEPTLQSVEWERHYCLKGERYKDYMPDFYTDEKFDWWQPFEVKRFNGRNCYDYNPNGLAANYNIMVDYGISSEATVYIEEYSIDSDHKRALMDD
jgi:hypothetical protein